MRIVYEDRNHQEATRLELDWCLESVQAVLDEYSKLKITKCDNIHLLYGLIHEPDETIQLEMKKKARIARGGNLDLKPGVSTPIGLGPVIRAAAQARQYSFVDRSLGLFDLEGDKVVMNSEVADKIIYNRSIIAQSEQQEELVDKLEEFTDLFNELDLLLGGRFLTNKADRALWGTFFDVPLHGSSSARINPERIREYLMNI